jgi:hypothetical protein
MRRLENVNVLRGSIAWTNRLRLKIAVFPDAEPQAAPIAPPAQEARVERDEDGRVWAFRYPRAQAQGYSIDRDRIFDYLERRRLPGATARQIRRDARNRVDFISDVRDIQTPPDVEPLQ